MDHFLYLETAPGSRVFRFRGRLDTGDDAQSFAAKVGEKGHHVVVTPQNLGATIGWADGDGRAPEAPIVLTDLDPVLTL